MFLLLAATLSAPLDLFSRDNLVAWCVVPFDAKKRGPDERVPMLKELGFKKYAYDWRAEHLPTFDREVELLKTHGIELTAVWFPAALTDDAKKLLAVVEARKVTPQLWVMPAQPKARTEPERAAEVADGLRPVVELAAKAGCKVGLYNHGGWAGRPENMVAVIDRLGAKHVGIVYNLHHGHGDLDRFPERLAKMKPHLLCLNLNGMTRFGDVSGKKIQVIGHGDRDRDVLIAIRESGYAGPVGVIGHTNDDVRDRLRDNLDGLDWLTGKTPGPRPTPRTQPGR